MGIIQGIKDYRLLRKNMYQMTRSEVMVYQREQLLQMVDYASANSPFYKDLYQGTLYQREENQTEEIYNIDCEKAFFNLPIINKQIMMDHFDDLNTCGLKKEEVLEFALKQELSGDYAGYYKGSYVIGLSSGTSGNKGIFVTPREMTERLPFVFLARGGIPLAYLPFRILFLLRVFSQGFSDINSPFIKLNYMSTMTAPEELIDRINKQKLTIIMAPPSMLRILLGYAEKICIPLKMIISYAEVLEEEEKDRIEKAFKCKVNEIYQASEGQLGSTCKCGNLHINEDLVFVELYDEAGKEVNEPGKMASKMLVTNLVNKAQPLIRYEMNDLVILGEKCLCGSSFRVIEKILGRHDDVLYLKTFSGEIKAVFPDLFARWIITTDDKIREFKVFQKSNEELAILIDLNQSANQSLETTYENQPTERINRNGNIEKIGVSKVEAAIIEKLSCRIVEELQKIGIQCKLTVTCGPIALPEKMSKYKRFESNISGHTL